MCWLPVMAKKKAFGTFKGEEILPRTRLTTGDSINIKINIFIPKTSNFEKESFTSLDDLKDFLQYQNPYWLEYYVGKLKKVFEIDGVGVELKIKLKERHGNV